MSYGDNHSTWSSLHVLTVQIGSVLPGLYGVVALILCRRFT